MKILLLFLLLTVPALAQLSPEAVVGALYDADRKHEDFVTSLNKYRAYLTPALYTLLMDVQSDGNGKLPSYDLAILAPGQVGYEAAKIGKAHFDQGTAVVPVTITFEKRFIGKPAQVNFYLTKIGRDYRVYDIWHLGNPIHKVRASARAAQARKRS